MAKKGNKKTGFSFINRYRRFFLSERTALIAAVVTVLGMPVIYYLGSRSGGMDLSGKYNLILRLLLVIALFYSMKKHKLFLMQASAVGLLFCMLCAQSQYALSDLAVRDSETYITMGAQGFVFLAVEMMILFIMSFVCLNHFIIYALRRQGAIRIHVNQIAILFLMLLIIVQLVIAPILSFELDYVLYVWTLHLDELFIFILVACGELILMIDQNEAAEV